LWDDVIGMCVNVLMTSRGRESAPLELQSDRIHNVYLEGDQQTDRALVPAERRKRQPSRTTTRRMGTHHKAVVAKHRNQERARDAERPRRGHDGGLSSDEGCDGDERVEQCGE
jgi:hypothetical protein